MSIRRLILTAAIGAASYAPGQTPPPTFTTIYSFTSGTGSGFPPSYLVLGSGGVLYGLAGTTIFSLTPPTAAGDTWTVSTLYGLTLIEGVGPEGLVIGSGGVLYGVTSGGGTGCNSGLYVVDGLPYGCGTMLSLTPPSTPGASWTFEVIYYFPGGIFYPGSNDEYPDEGLVIGPGGVLYGTTGPVVFSLTPPPTPGVPWTHSDLSGFSEYAEGHSGLSLGYSPSGVQALYAAGYKNGAQVPAEVFSLSPAGPGGAWTKADVYYGSTTGGGEGIYGTPAVGAGGVLYETGGTAAGSEIFSLTPPASSGGLWTKTTLYVFTPEVDWYQYGGLTVGSDGTLYGVTLPEQCNSTCGILFSLAPPAVAGGPWTETTLHTFTGGVDGGKPYPALVIGTDGTLYGSTTTGGIGGGGTIFSVDLPVPQPSVNPGGLVSAASYTAPVAPGSIASVFGSFFVPPLGATQSPLPAGLSGLSLAFGSTPPAPLFYVSGGQVNLQVPWELAGQPQTNLAATLNGSAGTAQMVNLATFAPAIFTINAQGSGQGAILDQSNRLVDVSNPATPGATVLQIFCTGLGPVTNQPLTGSPAPSGPLSYTTATPAVTIGGVSADVFFSGLAPGFVGLYQVNAQVPAGLAPDTAAPVVISMQGTASNTVTIAVQ
jgi:uncharacterized protein (TIGR03437 family)